MAAASASVMLVQLAELYPDGGVEAQFAPFFAEAGRQGVDLVAFPEYFLGNRIPVDHPTIHEFRRLAAENGVYAVGGLIEAVDNRQATTALLVDRQGNIAGQYRKTHPTTGYPPHCWPPVAGYDDEPRGIVGNEFCAFDLDFARVGILQCYDGCFPESWACTAHLGAEIILWINGRPSMIQDAYCIAAAHAHGCVAGATIAQGHNTGFASTKFNCIQASGEPEEMRLFPRIPARGDGAVTAQIDLVALRTHRKHLRTAHQRRPDLYGSLIQDWPIHERYPDIPWCHPDAPKYVNRAQLPPKERATSGDGDRSGG